MKKNKAAHKNVVRGTLLCMLMLLVAASASWSVSSAQAQSGPGWSNTGYPRVFLGIDIDRVYDGRCGDTCDFYFSASIEGHQWNNEDKGSQDLYENQNSIRPAFWRMFVPVNIKPSHSLQIGLYDEDGGFQGGDDHLDISPTNSKDHYLTLDFYGCNASGNIGNFKGLRKDGMCEISVENIGGTAGDRARIDYKIIWYYETTFYKPTFDGYRLDYCAAWANYCGDQAAHEWCQAVGNEIGLYEFTGGYQKEDHVSPTRVIRTGQVCNNSTCDSFAYITCTTFKYGPT